MDIIQGLIASGNAGRSGWRILNNKGTFGIVNNRTSNVSYSILNNGVIGTGSDFVSTYVASSSSPSITATPSATTTGTTGNYTYQVFTYTTETAGAGTGQSLYNITVPTGGVVCDVLVVGGGGGGSGGHGGGGGAGQLVFINQATLNGTYTVKVGKGGTGGRSTELANSYPATKGGNTTFSTVIAEAGGANTSVSADKNGGSGAGGDYWTSDGGTGGFGVKDNNVDTFASGTVYSRGNNGGNINGSIGGGGGGAGVAANLNVGGDGLSGITEINYDFLQNFGASVGEYFSSENKVYFAGGGGGGAIASIAGKGGGGIGGALSGVVAPSGLPNTGGGGGGGAGGSGTGGNGGSGVVIIRYLTPTTSSSVNLIQSSNINVITNYVGGVSSSSTGGGSSQWTTVSGVSGISGPEIYYNDGNVGIGTLDPVAPLHIYNNTTTATLPTEIVVAGTTSVTISGTTDRVISFPYSGSATTKDYTFTTTENLICDILIVGGGGAGGNSMGGGGGAGGLVYTVNQTLNVGTYTVSVGKGGLGIPLLSGGQGTVGTDQDGKDSFIQSNSTDIVFSMGGVNQSLRGKGGGGGGIYYDNSLLVGRAGGSGGGAADRENAVNNGGASTQGNTYWNGSTYVVGGSSGNGNLTTDGGFSPLFSAGGGGAGNTLFNNIYNGKTGVQISITGTPLFYAAGGGGGILGSSDLTRGLGGSSIGGNGRVDSSLYDGPYIREATSGADGTGSGGGGNSYVDEPRLAAGSGGSGIVIIRYRKQTQPSVSNARLLLDATTTGTTAIEFRRGTGGDAQNDFRIINDTNSSLKLQCENSAQSFTDSTANIAWFSSNETILYKNTTMNGRVGIGGTTYHATRSLDVVGDANVFGAMSAGSLSVNGNATITNSSSSNVSLTIQNGFVSLPTAALELTASSPSVSITEPQLFNVESIYPPYRYFTYNDTNGIYTVQNGSIEASDSTNFSYTYSYNDPANTQGNNEQTSSTLKYTHGMGLYKFSVGGTQTAGGTSSGLFIYGLSSDYDLSTSGNRPGVNNDDNQAALPNGPGWYVGTGWSNSTTYNSSYYYNATFAGAWIKIELPIGIVFSSFKILGGYQKSRAPKAFKIYGSNTNTTTAADWTLLHTETNYTYNAGGDFGIKQTVTNNLMFKNYLMVVSEQHTYDGGLLVFQGWYIYGKEKLEPVVINSDYKYLSFTHSGGTETQTSYTVNFPDSTLCDILVVGGGGGGGNDRGGGGGGGGVIYSQNITLNGTYTINVGKEGVGTTSGTGGGTGTRGTNGSNSSISGSNITTITAIGGGGGAACNPSFKIGLDGGSGGGGSQYNGAGSGGTGTIGQGNNGGIGYEGGAAGGGGGAVAVGTNANSTNAGNGGIGLSNSITGTVVIYGSGGGGGGSSGSGLFPQVFGTGGSIGAGNGANGHINGNNATIFGCGGGGAGIAYTSVTTGGKGFAGVVIIRYKSTKSGNQTYKVGNFNGEFKVISSVSNTDTDYIKITTAGAITNPTGTASWNTGSDRRIKENIERASYDKCFENINRLELNRFNYVSGFNTVNRDRTQLGFIAQEVQDIFPKSISSQEYYSNTLNIPDLLSIDVSQINYSLYGAVKKLIEINNEKDVRLKTLGNRLKTLKTFLNIADVYTSNITVDTTVPSTSNVEVIDVIDISTSNITADT